MSRSNLERKFLLLNAEAQHEIGRQLGIRHKHDDEYSGDRLLVHFVVRASKANKAVAFRDAIEAAWQRSEPQAGAGGDE